ncbi:hypothetical protein [Oricola sp.]|uniref:hypothetical protein n=1 Tax=Oricola sp. TaxID=1979950 RepID=UPI0025DB04A2|nr:hypothetical protein [Oricola sp.]MCI5078227.1 hypothetical protein [Oricola sp.]
MGIVNRRGQSRLKVRRRHLFSGFVRAFCVLSLILAAFSHRPALARDTDAAAQAFVFPDGSVATNCLTGGGDDGGHGGAPESCEFCRIAGSVAVPAPPAEFEYCTALARDWLPLPTRRPHARQALRVVAAPRGPPVSRS